jgi:hypothetical protein
MKYKLFYQPDSVEDSIEICKLSLAQFMIFENIPNPKFIVKNDNSVIIKIPIFENVKRVPDVWRYNLEIKQSSIEKNDSAVILKEPISKKVKSVPDAWRYHLEIKQSSREYELASLLFPILPNSKFAEKPALNIPNSNKCLLIIESPHKDEYIQDGSFQPISPAQGKTGNNINNKFQEAFNKYISREANHHTYQLVICNPVQLQSSLHYIHNKSLKGPCLTLRNNVWKWLFLEFGWQDNFINRLHVYNPKIIINACTSRLRDLVSKALLENVSYFPESKIYKCSHHPSAWWNPFTITKISKEN